MGKSAPKAPDYTAAAEAQGESSRQNTEQQTWANRPDINTPFGSQSWQQTPEYDPTTGQMLNKWTQNTTLDPKSQHALDSQLDLTSGRSDLANSLFPRAQNEFGSAMNWDNFSQAGGVPQTANYGDFNTNGLQGVDSSQKYSKDAGDAIYGQWENRMAPRMQQEMEQNDTKLRNQGLKPGDQAYDAAMQRMTQDQGDARTNAQYQATIGSGAEAQRMMGMDSANRQQQFGERTTAAGIGDTRANNQFSQNTANSNLQTQQRQQQIAEAMQKRGFSLNEINAIISGQQVGMPTMPSFNQAGKADTTNYSGAANSQYNAALDASNASNAGLGNLLGAGAQLGSTAMMFSDRRLKTNIVRIGGDPRGFGLYRWDWKSGGSGVGVIADEVAHLGVVHRHENGYDMVDYGRLDPRAAPATH
jgi:hypothetical protein